MNALDSRVLTPYNCYIQKILGGGELQLDARVASAGFTPIPEKPLASIKINTDIRRGRGDRRDGKQHNVSLIHQDPGFSFEVDDLQVTLGDALLFHLPLRGVPPFSIRGRTDEHEFTSVALEDQAVFTHPFGLAGDYEWTDANGSGIEGLIHVVDDPADGRNGAERTLKQMSEGVLIHIVGNRVVPQEVTIVTGQTVFLLLRKRKGLPLPIARCYAENANRPVATEDAANSYKPEKMSTTLQKVDIP